MSCRIGIDIGGTFTDFALLDGAGQRLCLHKQLTTPDDPARSVLTGVPRLLAKAGVAAGEVDAVVHGTTLVTNALIERRVARTAMLVTAGFADVLDIARERRYDMYELGITYPEPLVPRALRFELRERVDHRGAVLQPLDEAELAAALDAMAAQGVQALAVCLLNSPVNPAHEQRAARIARERHPGLYVSTSAEVFPFLREYERWTTTTMNACTGPLFDRYLARLEAGLREAGLRGDLFVMSSSGGMVGPALARRFPVRMLESGPAAGVLQSAALGPELGRTELLAFDMGGTTAKICLIGGGEPERARRFEIARAWRNLKGSGLPVRVPVIELVEIGAGGGSIGRVDAMGRITVGPDSCGAEPGPACYGRGGTLPAVTDANLVLGRIDAARFAAGRLPLDRERAEQALADGVGAALGMDAFWAAAGVSEIVEENMANAARVHAIERGRATEEHTMIAFGGAAPLHAGRLAQKLGIRRVLVPAGAGVGSAIGFLRAPVAFEVVRSDLALLRQADPAALQARLDAMAAQARAVVEPAAAGQPLHEVRLAELRYAGQGHELRVRLPGAPDGRQTGPLDAAALAALGERFEQAYEQVYGLRIPGSAVEVVTWSVTVSTAPPPAERATLPPAATARAPEGRREAWEPGRGERQRFALHWRFDLAPGQRVDGPALVAEHETTAVVPAGWQARLDDRGHLWMEAA